MTDMGSLARSLGAWGVVALLGATAVADEVHLRGGAVLTGRAEAVGGGFLLRTAHGEIRIPADRVERVVESEAPVETYARKAGELDCSPESASAGHGADPHVELARWCETNGMGSEARTQYGCALAHDPADPRALAAIGGGEEEAIPQDEEDRAGGRPFPDENADGAEGREPPVGPDEEAVRRSDRRAFLGELMRLREEMAQQRREAADRDRRDLLRARRRIVVYGDGYTWNGFPMGSAYVGPYFVGLGADGGALVAPWPGSLPAGLNTFGNYTAYGLGLGIRYENRWRGGSIVIHTGR